MVQHRVLYGEEILPVTGEFPEAGSHLPSFMLVDDQFNDLPLEHFNGQPKVILTLLSIDENEHGGLRLLRETRRFLERWPQLQLVVISVDSPSSLRRARKEHGLPGVALLSTLRGRDFHKRYGVLISEYPLAGYTAPAIILADGRDEVFYSERLRDTLDDFNFDTIAAILAEAEIESMQTAENGAAAREEGGGKRGQG
ncbi:redoxin domain-containing protein [Paludibacterium paludis]|uniref:Thiol peroxidase n=1 Tax=Paludibacterium paludis TaxID=1225769 RepID=A0A918NX29_9NEIS|nr:redoxin domain-containing protein [Paludibacterium paludis]GGY02034.1 putative thiol peroxidase [Paludibacterium paludis]